MLARWQDAHGDGLEHCQLDDTPQGMRLSGAIAGTRDSSDGCFYVVLADARFHTREVHVSLTSGAQMHIMSDGNGHWHDLRGGSALPGLRGCLDIDIGMTPATNTLPMRRLNLAIGASAVIEAAYVPLPGEFARFAARRIPQRYTRLAKDLWRYDSLDRDFSARLRTDDSGLVLDYPGLYRRR